MIVVVTEKIKREIGYRENKNHAQISVTELLEKQNPLEFAVDFEGYIIKRSRIGNFLMNI